jgi:hypothetical protein
MIRSIYPRTGFCGGTYLGALEPMDLPHHVDRDLTSSNMQVQGGAWVQFLPGVQLTGQTDAGARIAGRSPDKTRFYTDGLPTRGLKAGSGGQTNLTNGGTLRMP